jgi:transposase
MARYIGLDAHSTSCTFAVIGPSGRRLGTSVVETAGHALVEFVRSVPRPRHLCIEEGTLSAWLYEVLSPLVDEMVVAAVGESQGQKSDRLDAFGLGEGLRVGSIRTRVYKEAGPFLKLRRLARVHRAVVGDVVRVRNRLKALYRSRGVPAPGRRVYGTNERASWLDRLDPATRLAARTLYAELDALTPIEAQAQDDLITESHRHPVTRVLETVPGLGPIRVAHIVPIVVTPYRFRTKRQFWSYCGFGIVMRSSSDWVRNQERWVRTEVARTRGLSRSHNRTLKWVFKGAATTVIGRSGPLRAHYDRLLAAGTKPNLAKLTVARKIAATALAVWKNQEVYDPKYHPVPTET